MTQLQLIFLDTFQAKLDGEPITGFRSDKVRALLAYLAIEAAQPHRRDQLAGLLWPEWPETSARANLRHALSNLRTVLQDKSAKPPYLLIDRQSIQFNLSSQHHLDVAEFNQHLAVLAAVTTGSVNETVVQHLQQAVSLYTGPFLHDFFLADCSAFEEWSLLTRERLQVKMLEALDVLVHHFEQQGDYQKAQNYVRQQLTIDPLREAAHRQLMHLLALDNQRSAALVQFETLRRLLSEELGVSPSVETRDLHQQIQSGQLQSQAETLRTPIQVASPPHNLPAQPTRFIGRETELAALQILLLRPDVRLLTLTGPGGTGKTRLSLRLADEMLDHFEDGIFFVALSTILEADLVIPTIAKEVGVKESGDEAVLTQLKDALLGKHLLLVLDNFEHVTSAASAVSDLLIAAPNLKILVTSRALLHLYGEHNYPIPPLDVPDRHAISSAEYLQAYGACKLFVDRARMVRPDFRLTDEMAPAVAEICTRLDGLPLAIELAAGRLRLLSPQKLLSQLKNRLQFLNRGPVDVPARQQTLRNTIDWSYELLTPDDQTLFRRLAVFTGGCTLEAAEVVGNAPGASDVFSGLESLVDKSLLNQVEGTDEPRFVMLETLREYALERLEQSKEVQFIWEAYSDYYLSLVEQLTQTPMEGDQEWWLGQLEIELNNLRTVLRWTNENQATETGLRLVALLWRFWEMHGYFSEGRRWLKQVLDISDNVMPAAQAEAYTGAGTLAWHQNDYQQALIHHQQALTLYQALGDEKGSAFALNNIGVQYQYQLDFEQAIDYLEQSLVLAQKADTKFVQAGAFINLGEVARHQRNFEKAVNSFEEALNLGRELGNTWMNIAILNNLGRVTGHLKDYRSALAYLNESLNLCRNIGDKRHIAECLEVYAIIAIEQAQWQRAAQLWGAAEAFREEIAAPLPQVDRENYERRVALTRDTLGETTFAVAWSTGRSMKLEEAMVYALGEQSP